MNILIPMAGAGSRFLKEGYVNPKPLIDINGKPMIQVVYENLNLAGNYIFLVLKEHYEKYNLQDVLYKISPNCKIIQIEKLTEGAACTTLLAEQFIDNDEKLLIVNSDQWIDWNSVDFELQTKGDSDGSILTFESNKPIHSYIKLDQDGFVEEVKEKEVISNFATVGIYYWKSGAEYVKYAKEMINKNIRINNEFYIAPVYTEAINDNKKITAYNVTKMYSLGTPDALELFIKEKDIHI